VHNLSWVRGALAAMGLVGLLAACSSSSDPLAITCSDYMKKSATAQEQLAALWGSGNRHRASPDTGGTLTAPANARLLRDYCGNSAHEGAKLTDLNARFGLG
jgi:hypothetical protein